MPELTRDEGETLFSYTLGATLPSAGSEDEKLVFRHLQEKFAAQYENAFPDSMAAKTVIIVPSLSLDQEILQKLDGAVHYEERLLCLLLLLRMPRTHVIYLTSVPIDPVIVDYYLHLLPGITGYHARQRLTLLSCYDASPRSLTEKILERPRMIHRIKKHIPVGHLAHIACFNVTGFERTLAVQLGLPIFGCDPDLYHWGTKSNSRKLFKECGLLLPDGMEDLTHEQDIAHALCSLKKKHPKLLRAVVKMNEGFSGEGNAIYTYNPSVVAEAHTVTFVQQTMPTCLKPVAAELTYQGFIQKFTEWGGIVEVFLEGELKKSPSVQCRITPLGKVEVISTHDQLLGGEGGQVFLGAHFPAPKEYAGLLGEYGSKIGQSLQRKGVIGRFAIDFISVKKDNEWEHFAIEINLRKGGTTHPYIMLNYLTDGTYHPAEGVYTMANGQERFYYSSDNLHEEMYRGLTPHDLIDISMIHKLRYDGTSQEGVVFHMIGALSQFGKLGVVCIGDSPQSAERYYQRTCEVLRKECRR